MKFSIKILLFSISVILNLQTKSQELEQIFNLPQYYNSAFAGFEPCSIASISNKMHYITSKSLFLSNNLYIDYFSRKISGALKLNIHNSISPNNIFNKNKFSFAYTFHNHFSKQINYSLSLETNYLQQNINQNHLIYADMISVYTSFIYPSSEFLKENVKNEIYFSGGFLIYSKKYFFSIFVDNFFSIYNNSDFNEFTKITLINEYRLYKRRNIYKIYINSAVFMFKNYCYFTNGITYKHKYYEFALLSKQNIFEKHISNGLSIYMSTFYNKIQFAYSYTFYTGKLFFKKSSIHEITMKFRFNCTEKNKNNTIICPTY